MKKIIRLCDECWEFQEKRGDMRGDFCNGHNRYFSQSFKRPKHKCKYFKRILEAK